MNRRAFTLIEMLTIGLIVALLVGMVLPAVQQARDAARRMQCRCHLMQVGVALRNYESAHGGLPPGTVDPQPPIRSNNAQGYHFGWIVQILPHLEEANAFYDFDFSVSVHDKRNLNACSTLVTVLHCPSAWGGRGSSTYAACHHDVEAPIDVDNSGVMFANSFVRREDVTDGAANTIFVGESAANDFFGWASGTRATLRNTGTPMTPVKTAPGGMLPVVVPNLPAMWVGGFSSTHSGGANFLFGDGSVRFLNEGISMAVYRQLGNRADGELLGGPY